MHQKDAIGIALHRIEHAPARSLEAQEERQDREQDGSAEGGEEQAIARLIPMRQYRGISQYLALDGDQHPQQAIGHERRDNPAPAALCQPSFRAQHAAVEIRSTYSSPDEEVGGI